MTIIPAVNCKNFNCVKEKLAAVKKIGAHWIQIDIADGKFTKYKTWNNPRALRELRAQKPEFRNINIETHLMVKNPLAEIDKWISAGAKRIIIHAEVISPHSILSSPRRRGSSANTLDSHLRGNDIFKIGLAINPETPVKNLIPFLENKTIKFVQLLAVHPGKSGQKFQPQILEKIKFLKNNFPKVKIEIDGGINLRTAKQCQKAGADMLVVGSYIWENKNPKLACQKLTKI